MGGNGASDIESVVVFRLGGRGFAVPVAAVREVVPFAWLARPVQMPSVVEGILNLGGGAVPVLRLGRLLDVADARAGLESSILIMRGASAFGLLVDRVDFVRRRADFVLAPVAGEGAFNGCVTGMLERDGEGIPLLSWDRLLVEEERVRLAEFQARAQARLADMTDAVP